MDLDADSRIDMISGSYHPGSLYLFRRNEDGTFAAGEEIAGEDGQPLNVGAAAHVHAADWNGDDHLDLLVGNIDGQVWLIPNTGGPMKFGEPVQLEDAAGVVKVSNDAGPHAADWDGDGKIDLLVGTGDGQVLFYRNTSQSSEPQLDQPQVLLPARKDQDDYSVPWGMRLKVHATDFNKDGKLDLLVGDFRMEQENPENAQKYTDLRKEYDAMIGKYQEMSSKAGDGLLTADEQKEFEALRKKLMQVINEMQPLQGGSYATHGNVWVFLRQ